MFKIIIKSKKGSTSILFILLSLSPLFLNIAYTKKASVIIKTNILINTIDNIIHKGNLKNTWNNLSLTEQKKFINYKDFKQFIINKYYPLDITIKNIKYRKETYKILFQIKNNNKYHIPSFYNTHYFTFSLNKNNKLKNLGIFSPNTPIISYSKNTNLIIKIPILMLHRVSPIYPKRNLYSSEYAYLLDYNLTLLSQSFNAQLQYLKNNHYNSITLTRLYDFYYYNLPLPQNPIIISFDDGRLSDFKYALPLLLKYHFKAEFNIITGFVGSINKTQKYMNWKQIETLYKDGMEIESHTVTHVALGILNTAEINYQLIISKDTIQKKLNSSVQFIAYPGGSPFRNNNIKKELVLENRLRFYGYIAGLVDQNFNRNMQNLNNSFGLFRLRDSNISLSEFIKFISENTI